MKRPIELQMLADYCKPGTPNMMFALFSANGEAFEETHGDMDDLFALIYSYFLKNPDSVDLFYAAIKAAETERGNLN